jgi:uncharacterized protein YdgA (DUF945 family)
MRKKIITLSATLFGVGALYLVAVAVIGSGVSTELEKFETTLIARDDVRVIQFEYDRNFWGGRLSYDLSWSALQANPLADELLRELGAYDGGFRWRGELDIQHGPWLGGADIGLAAVRQAVPLPDQLRAALPQYPGQAPVVAFKAALAFNGDLIATVSVIDYDGRIISDSESIELELAGLAATLVYSNQQQRFSFELGTDIAAVSQAQSAGMRLNGLGLSAEFSEDVSGALLGGTRFELAELMIDWPQQDINFLLKNYAVASDVKRVDDTVTSAGSFSIDELSVNDTLLGGIELESSLRGINIDAYVLLENLLLSSSFEDNDALLQALQTLAADQLSFNVDRLVLKLPTEEDVSASLSVAYNGSDQIDVDNYADILGAISLEAQLEASTRAIDRAIVGAGLPAEQTSQIQDVLQASYQTPYLTLNGDRLTSSLQVRRGEVRVNGELMGDASALLALADDVGGASATPPSTSVDKRAAAAQQCPDFSQSGTLLSYSSDDLYAPQSMSVVAGGSVNLSNCPSIPGLGYVTQAPDYKLEFSGNSAGRELEFRLDSACDTILLLNDTSGTWYHDDDSNGNLDAKIRLPKAGNGVYDIWVGTLNADNCDATLTIETF